MDKSKSAKTPGLTANEQQEVHKNQPPRAAVVHEIIRVQGDKELQRTATALWWSALAAGLSMGLSLMAMGLLRARLEGVEGAHAIACIGYSAGFLAVILARQQLFTENTLTAVLPVMNKPSPGNFARLGKLWSVVLLGNLAGTLLVAYVMLHLPIFDAATDAAFLDIGRKLMESDSGQMFAKGIVSGWMIATMVWMIPAQEQAKVWIIVMVTSLMALGDFTHIVVGSVEAFYLVFAGELAWVDYWLVFAMPTLAGNIVGGSFIFALISHAQVRSDVELQEAQREERQARLESKESQG
ncbi:formate/nitrite transporter family protein [Metapseudomonas resinovorans]|uniref:Putative FNT family transporter n=1 Tax=Metapseudomonas resinovorans NBRC 106553 TaxID=1245471 RepID=S6AVC9_METRE|nr:formate/nitrite transporter family protein [Pseudomonas resinovorans]BAN48401.1 putative FNT family transporter [Pseudomonas resinovorans NBRC 106553]